MGTLRESIEWAKQNPNHPKATRLRMGIENGMFDEQADAEGIQLPGRPRISEPVFEPKNTAKRPSEEQGPDLQERLATVGREEGERISQALRGEGEFEDASLGTRATGATAAGFRSVPRGAFEFLPRPARKAVGKVGEVIGEGFRGVVDFLSDRKLLREIGRLEAEGHINPETTPRFFELKDQLKATGQTGEIAGTVAGAQGTAGFLSRSASGIRKVTPTVREGIQTTVDTAKQFGSNVKDKFTIFRKNGDTPEFDSPEQVMDFAQKQLDDLPDEASPSSLRQRAEAEAPELTATEKYVGLTPDVKKQIQGKEVKLSEYIDTAITRNLDPNAKTVYEFGGDRARLATEKMENILNDTGGTIGATRKKLSTARANVDQINKIENSFRNELADLGLNIRKGKIVRKSDKVRKTTKDADINTLNDLWNEFKIVKQNPTLENIISFRSLMDKRIRFDKELREISNDIDPVARNVRRDIKEVAADMVGKDEAQKLEQYSRFMDAYTDIKSFTDRKAGGEYLLRLVLSGRGGEARKIIKTIKEHTGDDLLDDAIMMKLVTDTFASENQKSLFKQQITSAGIDAARVVAGGGAFGPVETVARYLIDMGINPEKVLMKAASSKK